MVSVNILEIQANAYILNQYAFILLSFIRYKQTPEILQSKKLFRLKPKTTSITSLFWVFEVLSYSFRFY